MVRFENGTFKVPATPPRLMPSSMQSSIAKGCGTLRYVFWARALACCSTFMESSSEPRRSVKESVLRHACFPETMSNANFLAAGSNCRWGTTRPLSLPWRLLPPLLASRSAAQPEKTSSSFTTANYRRWFPHSQYCYYLYEFGFGRSSFHFSMCPLRFEGESHQSFPFYIFVV